MGKEVRIVDYNNGGAATGGRDADDDRVSEWEAGLPKFHDLTPLSQPLISPELASAFRISPEPSRSLLDVNRASQTTLASLRGGSGHLLSNNNFNKSLNDETTTSFIRGDHHVVVMDIDDTTDLTREGSDSRKNRRIAEFPPAAATEEADSAADGRNTNENSGGDDGSARTLKRPRLVWTPQLHKRFVDVVAHLGIKHAVPKTIMQLMNVEGLTRENVASHLQKYRLYLKRMQGLSSEGPSPSDHLFASTPVPQSLHESPGGGGAGSGSAHGHSNGGNSSNVHMGMPIPMPYPPPPNGLQMVPVPIIGSGFPAYESHRHHHHYSMMQQQQRDWSGNKFGYVAAYPHHVTPNDK